MTTNFEKHSTNNPIGKLALKNFMNTVVGSVKSLKPESILDVGSGEGFTLARFHTEKIGKKLEGIEYMKEALELGKKLHPHIQTKPGNIYKLPYKDNMFDLVLSTEVLEHLDEPGKGLKELIRVSKKYVLLTVPNEPWFTVQRFMRGRNMLKLGAHPEHVNLWTSKKFEDFVKNHNVKIVHKKQPFPWIMILAEKKK